MAKLFEFQGKDLFRRVGIPVPEGEVVDSPPKARQVAARIGYPVAVKAQILSGGRGKIGAVLFADNDEELVEAADQLLNCLYRGQAPQGLLVEKKQAIEKEYYLAVTADSAARRPVIIFSQAGGVDVENAFKSQSHGLLQVKISTGPRRYQIMDMLRPLGLLGAEMVAISDIALKAYRLYRQYDCTLVEINPLCLTEGQLMALDAKVSLDDDAIARLGDLGFKVYEDCGDRPPTVLELAAGEIDEHDHRGSVHFVQIDPDCSFSRSQGRVPIGFDGVGGGSSLVMFDELIPLGYQPVNFCDTSGNPVGSKLYRITKVILAQKGIEGYVFAICVPSSQRNDNLLRGVIKAIREVYEGREPDIPMVFAIQGTYAEEAIEVLEKHGLPKYRWVRVLKEANHRETAQAFAELYQKWKTGGMDAS